MAGLNLRILLANQDTGDGNTTFLWRLLSNPVLLPVAKLTSCEPAWFDDPKAVRKLNFPVPVVRQRDNKFAGVAADWRHLLSVKEQTMFTILIILLVLMLVGAFPAWPYSRSWGYYPSGGLGLIVLILVILLLMGRV
jgi:hypothetical protein